MRFQEIGEKHCKNHLYFIKAIEFQSIFVQSISVSIDYIKTIETNLIQLIIFFKENLFLCVCFFLINFNNFFKLLY